jgi:hypothetical protein
MDEVETCRAYVRPGLEAAGWDDQAHPIVEQKSFTDGRIVPLAGVAIRGVSACFLAFENACRFYSRQAQPYSAIT